MDADEELRSLFARYSGDGSTADAVHNAVTEAILSNALPPGRRLREEQLAAAFSVSRTPVREALMRLESERLASRHKGNGLMVAALDPEQILEIYVIREALDGVAARQAAHFRGPVDIATLKRINAEVAAAAGGEQYEVMARLNVEFHKALASASRNELLQHFVDQIHQAVRRFQRTTFSAPGRAAQAIQEHAAIINAIAAGDQSAAEAKAREHMHRALEVRMLMEAERRD